MNRYNASNTVPGKPSNNVIYKKAPSPVSKDEGDQRLPDAPMKTTMKANVVHKVHQREDFSPQPSFTMSNRETFGESVPEFH